MERLLHYIWQHHIYPLKQLKTTDGVRLEVVNPGLHNEHSGSDFFNAQIRLGEEMWEGNVEIHTASSDWYKHGHHEDTAYDNVILHVVERADVEVQTSNGRKVPQLVLSVPSYIEDQYNELLREEQHPPCHQIVAEIPRVKLRGWLDALFVERLEAKTVRINNLVERLGGDWEKAMFVTLARSMGFGVNGDVFEEWSAAFPLSAASKHRDNLFQLEAMFLGTAGLLQDEMLPLVHRREALQDDYYHMLQSEYRYLSHKFSLSSIDGSRWRFLRLRPQNFPYIRLSQLVTMFGSNRCSLSSLMEAATLGQLREALLSEATDYWQTHYVFGVESAPSAKSLSQHSIDTIIINCVVPMLFAWGTHRESEVHRERALSLLLEIKAEKNHIISNWAEADLQSENAADSQALIQLHTQYCQRKDCLRCVFGMEFFNRTEIYPTLNEPENE